MIKNKITCKSHISQRSFLYGWRTNNTRTEMTTSRKEKEKIDITHYSIDDKGIKQIWKKSQKCDFYALHLINCQTIIIFNHQFSRFSFASSVLGVFRKNGSVSCMVSQVLPLSYSLRMSLAVKCSNAKAWYILCHKKTCTSSLSLC